MNCPRCDRTLTRYALSDGDSSAVVCDACGFVDVPASQDSSRVRPESWKTVVERATAAVDERTVGEHARVEGSPFPDFSEDSRPEIDEARLEETVSVSSAIADSTRRRRERPDASESTDATIPVFEPPEAARRDTARAPPDASTDIDDR